MLHLSFVDNNNNNNNKINDTGSTWCTITLQKERKFGI